MQFQKFVFDICLNWRPFWQAFSENFTGLELEDGGGRGTSGLHFVSHISFSFTSPPSLCMKLLKFFF